MSDEYRQHLIDIYEQLSLGYSKTLVTLAGGALGLSLTFAKTVAGEANACERNWLILSWVFWSVSLTAVLIGYFLGREAARFALAQFDDDRLTGDNPERAGGKWTAATHGAGLVSLISFIIGMTLFIVFAAQILG